MTDAPDTEPPIPALEDMQHWTLLMGRAQQMIMEAWADNLGKAASMPGFGLGAPAQSADPMAWMSAGAEAWSKGLESWSQIVRRLVASPSLDDHQRQRAFLDEAFTDIKRKVGEYEAEQYGRAGRLDYSWQGLSRYWRKQLGLP